MTAPDLATDCTTGRCAYGVPCTCAYYADWPRETTGYVSHRLRSPGRFYCEGHRAGRADAMRRLWQHLDDEGRRMAAAIARQGDDADD